MKRILLIIILLSTSLLPAVSQELNARLTINAQKVQSTNRDVFVSLQASLNKLLNDQRWTDATFTRSERIDCSFAIIINEVVSETSFKAEIQVVSRRPVYNSSYITQTFNYRDTKFQFDYQRGQVVDFNTMNITDNLTATLAFYAYLIIGIDFDTFSPNGGRSYFTKALNIANAAQSFNTGGWEPFSNSGNRYDLAIALTEDSSKDFHTLYYTYHRLGLDEMAANVSRGRIRVVESIADLQKLYDSRPSSPLLTVFAEAKLDEFVKIASAASAEEKSELKKQLIKIFPTKNSVISGLN